MSTEVVLDCESYASALKSLAQIFQCLPGDIEFLLSRNEIYEKFEEIEDLYPDVRPYLLDVVEKNIGPRLPLDAVCWFHSTRVLPGTTFSEGILPLNLVLPQIKEMLAELVDDVVIKEKLRLALENNKISNRVYQQKISGTADLGPFANLVREIQFDSGSVSQHSYLGLPEIIEDICVGFSASAELDLLKFLRSKLTPAIVKFSSEALNDEQYIGVALFYVSYVLRQVGNPACLLCCFDGGGAPVPPQNILRVDFVSTEMR